MKNKESDLFFPLKKYFNELGYKVFAEVPSAYRCVDFVAVKDGEHIAVEMKTGFTKGVVYQADTNALSFHKSCVAYPVKKAKIFNKNTNERDGEKYDHCSCCGIGILQILPRGTIFEALEAKTHKPYKEYDFSTFEENDNDEAGLPFQKGVSSAFVVLDRIKSYVKENPKAGWQEIYENIQHHYSSKASLSGSMSQWKGFNLEAFKKSIIS